MDVGFNLVKILLKTKKARANACVRRKQGFCHGGSSHGHLTSHPSCCGAYISVGLTFIEEKSSEGLVPLYRYVRRYWINQIGPRHISIYGLRT